jgi:hypothetical protein
MKIYGIEIEGPSYIEEVPALPGFESSDKARLIYTADSDADYSNVNRGYISYTPKIMHL